MDTRNRPRRDMARASRLASLTPDEPAGLMRDLHVRVLNCSAAGCLLEVREALAVGTVAELELFLEGRKLADAIEVVRCEVIAGSAVFHVGARFLPVAALAPGSLRYVLRREESEGQ